MGGVSSQFWAQLVRQVLYYKNLAALKGSKMSNGDATTDVVKAEDSGPMPIPDGGNSLPMGQDWTSNEQKTINDLMRKWAQWEVNFLHKFIRSTQCEGMTKNSDKICDECQRVAADESLKCSIRRVS